MYVRALSPEERAALEARLRSSDAFTLRRSQILLASRQESVAQPNRAKMGPRQTRDCRASSIVDCSGTQAARV